MNLADCLIANSRSHTHQLRLRNAIRANDLGPLLGEEFKSIRFADKPELLKAQADIIELIHNQMNPARLRKLLLDIKEYAS